MTYMKLLPLLAALLSVVPLSMMASATSTDIATPSKVISRPDLSSPLGKEWVVAKGTWTPANGVAALPAGADDAPRHRLEFLPAFAPSEGLVPDIEKPLRDEICLNGTWKFQPVALPPGFKRGKGIPPELAPPVSDRWEATPIKIPSPWNVNDWGTGPDAGPGTGRPYAPDSVYFPSYPPSWIGVEMGWLQRSFQVPTTWGGRRIVLHFEAVAGDAQVFVNGKLAGEHFDSFLPFDLDITRLVKPGDANELLVGVRKNSLYNIQSPGYPPGQQRTYPNGSNMDNLVGIWNDVYLWALPAVRVEDVFIQPQVAQGILRADVTLRNDTNQPQTVTVDASVSPWVNLAGQDTISAPEPKWKLDAPVLSLPAATVTIPAGGMAQTTLSAPGSALKLWSPDSANLYGMIANISQGAGQVVDRKYTRFGWREFRIEGNKLLLNGKPIQLFSDFGHPFGPFVCSRRYVWQDYKMIKSMGGNSVRPHANVMPRLWLDLADEMGICVIDESSIFGSSISLNLKAPVTWTRFDAHVDGLVRRDRDHPSVFGWSVANETYALFFRTNKADRDVEYAELKELAQRPAKLDPTRDWISMDGDQDLEGSLPVWSRHLGIGLPTDLPDLNKPLMIGEHGGTYYASPPLLASIGGDRAYESYSGRNEALARDLYRMIKEVARPKLAFFSASEMVWFGLEQLPFGCRTDERLPDKSDGVFFPNYVQNVPGVQIERLPPYVTTLNPGFDPALPPFKPMAMYEAMKAALDSRGPQPCPWDKIEPPTPRVQPPETDEITKVAFVGDRKGKLFSSLYALGVPLAAPAQAHDAKVLVIDGETVNDSGAALAKPLADVILHNGGLVWVMLRDRGLGVSHLSAILPATVAVTDRTATMLDRGVANPVIDGFNMSDLYFVADSGDCQIQKAGLDGPLVSRGRVLLTASNTDWKLFQRQPELVKCGAMLIYEHLKKSPGAALVEVPDGGGRLWLSTLDPIPTAPAFDKFWTQLWHNLGVKISKPPLHWIVPLGKGSGWNYTFATPPADWISSDLKDQAWSSGDGSFGSAGPGGPDAPGTSWTSPEIYLRHDFTLDRVPATMNLVLRHLGDVQIYINGTEVFQQKRAPGGGSSETETISLDAPALAALKPGSNIMAIHCLQGTKANLVDAGLYAGGEPGDASGPAHDLLLDGPLQ